jgi:carnitine-CoA ligase
MSGYRLDPSRTLPRVVARRASLTPDRIFVRHVAGPDLTYADVDRDARRWASALRSLGVVEGDRVATMLLPSAESLTLWLGIAYVGAIDTGVNVDFRGRMLTHVLELSQAEVLVADSAFMSAIEEIAGGQGPLRAVVVVGGDASGSMRLPSYSSVDLLMPDPPLSALGPDPWDIACLTFTSGTTGPSKGVLVPWGQLYVFSTLLFKIEDLNEEDVFLSPWPVYHTSGRFGAYMMALLGGTIVYKDHFQLSSWLDEVKMFGVTTMILWPLMIDSLRARPPSADDAEIPLRNVCAQWPPDHAELAQRFGLRMRSCFGMTEVPTMILPEQWSIMDHRAIGKVHKGFPGFEGRLVDEYDQEVLPGEPGELIVRSSTPWTMNAGYYRDPEATAKAWRNGWFHTGDMLSCDSDGNFSFLDRTTDSIRRRGENISSFEVEAFVLDHPEVEECAAVAVRVEGTLDQDVKIVVVAKPSSGLSEGALIAFLRDTMPRFMVPRYVELVAELPRTPSTMKVRKVELRAAPLNANTWDSMQTDLERPDSVTLGPAPEPTAIL